MDARQIALPLKIAGLAAVITWAAVVLRDEAIVSAAEQRMNRQSRSIERSEPAMATEPSAPSAATPPRALLADALFWARSAQTLADADPRRKMALDRAAIAAELAAGHRPYWGDAWAVRALVETLRLGPSAPEARSAFVRSYADAPFLRDAALWRIRFGFARWPALEPGTRKLVIDEAISLMKVEPALSASVFALARESPAYLPLALRWRTERTISRQSSRR